jgi:threonine synthase
LELGERHGLPLETLLSSTSLDDDQTSSAIRDLYSQGYLADPHSALAWAALDASMQDDEEGVFLCTAHPAKFLETMETTLGVEIPIPPELAAVQNEPVLSSTISGDFEALKRELEPLRK